MPLLVYKPQHSLHLSLDIPCHFPLSVSLLGHSLSFSSLCISPWVQLIIFSVSLLKLVIFPLSLSLLGCNFLFSSLCTSPWVQLITFLFLFLSLGITLVSSLCASPWYSLSFSSPYIYLFFYPFLSVIF